MHYTLSLSDAYQIVFNNKKINIDSLPMQSVSDCYEFLKTFASEKIIYGINTGFGPMAQWRIDDDDLIALQYNIIRSHATGAGEPLNNKFVKAAMIARLGTFLQCRSGVHPDLIRLLVDMINKNIFPKIPQHGSVGASGDLVQLAHLALTMIGEGEVFFNGKWSPAAEVLKENGLHPFKIHIREGLSITNGTSVMTGISIVNLYYAELLLKWSILSSVWINEIAGSYDDLMSEQLNEVKRHAGQQYVASKMREIAKDSKRLVKREHVLYEGHHTEKTFEEKVQAYYSLRCTPQILGPIYETIENCKTIVEDEINSACDNPIVDPESKNVYHGGNFHGDYISLEQDKLKIAIVRLAMTAERQLNYLFHDRINGILPPFLNLGKLGLNYGMQACQFTATSTTAECQTLAMPNYVHSIPNNNDNQDIVSMGTNTALLTSRVIDNAFQVMSIHFIALAQAVDCLKIADKLSTKTRELYDNIRSICPKFIEDTPFYEDIKQVEEFLRNN